MANKERHPRQGGPPRPNPPPESIPAPKKPPPPRPVELPKYRPHAHNDSRRSA